jgi:hypothetical protein
MDQCHECKLCSGLQVLRGRLTSKDQSEFAPVRVTELAAFLLRQKSSSADEATDPVSAGRIAPTIVTSSKTNDIFEEYVFFVSQI